MNENIHKDIIIYNQDCLEGLKKLESNSIQLVVTSPPYFNAKAYAQWETYEAYLDFMKDVLTELYRVLQEGRMCAINISPILIPRENRSSVSRRLNLPAHISNILEEIGFTFIEDIHWVKPEGSAKNRNGSFYQHRQPLAYKPNIVNEYILIYQKPIPNNKPIDKILRGYPEDIKNNSLVLGDYDRTNVWYMNPMTTSKHLAPYPQDLSDKIIKYYSFKGDTVLDPFMGSGTTAISCIDLQRKCVGYEYLEEYYNMILNRINSKIEK